MEDAEIGLGWRTARTVDRGRRSAVFWPLALASCSTGMSAITPPGRGLAGNQLSPPTVLGPRTDPPRAVSLCFMV